jgi:hypothetical protein
VISFGASRRTTVGHREFFLPLVVGRSVGERVSRQRCSFGGSQFIRAFLRAAEDLKESAGRRPPSVPRRSVEQPSAVRCGAGCAFISRRVLPSRANVHANGKPKERL